MTKYLVILRVSTESKSLSELSEILGHPGIGSHDIGSSPEGYWDATVWQIESDADQDQPLEEHLLSVFRDFNFPSNYLEYFLLHEEIELSIAAFLTTQCVPFI